MCRNQVRSLMLVVAGLSVVFPLAAEARPAPRVDAGVIVDLPVEFSVQNTNTSRVPCPPLNGASYVIRGHLVGPRRILSSSPQPLVTVYQPGFGFAQSYWHLAQFPAYDYASRLADLGHISLVYDPLGYGVSDHPPGSETCWGADADHTHQIVQRVRSGAYRVTGGPAVAFNKVVLASFYSAGLAAQPESYSYHDIDGLIVTSWAPQNFSTPHLQFAGAANAACAAGGEPASGDGGPSGYTFVPPTEADFRAFFFHDAEDAIVNAVASTRARVPCGEPQSAVQANLIDGVALRDVTVPVLLAFGTRDHAFDQPAGGESARSQYCETCDVTLEFVEGSGTALTLEKSAPRFRRAVADWLCGHDLAPPDSCLA